MWALQKYVVINCENGDKEMLHMTELAVEWCDKYTYLGSPFTADSSTTSAVKAQVTSTISHVLKFVSLIRKILTSHSS